jgi:hypothetical protein
MKILAWLAVFAACLVVIDTANVTMQVSEWSPATVVEPPAAPVPDCALQASYERLEDLIGCQNATHLALMRAAADLPPGAQTAEISELMARHAERTQMLIEAIRGMRCPDHARCGNALLRLTEHALVTAEMQTLLRRSN